MSYQESYTLQRNLSEKVAIHNEVSEMATKAQAALIPILEKRIEEKVLLKAGGFTNALGAEMKEALVNAGIKREDFYFESSPYSISLVLKIHKPLGESSCMYAKKRVYLGETTNGVLMKLTPQTYPLFTVEEVQALLTEEKALFVRISAIQSKLCYLKNSVE